MGIICVTLIRRRFRQRAVACIDNYSAPCVVALDLKLADKSCEDLVKVLKSKIVPEGNKMVSLDVVLNQDAIDQLLLRTIELIRSDQAFTGNEVLIRSALRLIAAIACFPEPASKIFLSSINFIKQLNDVSELQGFEQDRFMTEERSTLMQNLQISLKTFVSNEIVINKQQDSDRDEKLFVEYCLKALVRYETLPICQYSFLQALRDSLILEHNLFPGYILRLEITINDQAWINEYLSVLDIYCTTIKTKIFDDDLQSNIILQLIILTKLCSGSTILIRKFRKHGAIKTLKLCAEVIHIFNQRPSSNYYASNSGAKQNISQIFIWTFSHFIPRQDYIEVLFRGDDQLYEAFLADDSTKSISTLLNLILDTAECEWHKNKSISSSDKIEEIFCPYKIRLFLNRFM